MSELVEIVCVGHRLSGKHCRIVIIIHPDIVHCFFSGDGEQAAGRWKEHYRSHQRAAEDA